MDVDRNLTSSTALIENKLRSLSKPSSEKASQPSFDRFSIWGTSGVLGMTNGAELNCARSLLNDLLVEVEDAASRFRPDTEIARLNGAAGSGPISVSTMLFDLVATALEAADTTDGACDPTVGDAVIELGYDRDFDLLEDHAPLDRSTLAIAPGIGGIKLDHKLSTIELPSGVHLDLGATAKARCADRAAEELADAFDCGVLVDLGGDLRVAGPAPSDGWQIGVVTSARSHDLHDAHQVIALHHGAMASSSTAVRTWRRGAERLHHIVDPATGSSANATFSLVTVVGSTCVEANALSTAGVVWGEDALFELPQRGIAARLVRADGVVEHVGSWPEEREVSP